MRLKPLAFALLNTALATVLTASPTATAQGCSLCRDSTAGSAPQARKAFRLAIPLLGLPAIGIFAGALLVAKRIKPGNANQAP